jgi:hypothetical protein
MSSNEPIQIVPDPAHPQAAPIAASAPTSQGAHIAIATSTRSILAFYLCLVVAAVLSKASWRAIAFRYWWESLSILAVLLVALLVAYTRKWLEGADTSGRTALPVFGVPILVSLGLFISRYPQYQFYALRLPYLVLVTLLPGFMFYLFMVSKRVSLLNEFFANLDRLGLLKAPPAPPNPDPDQQQQHSEAYASWLRCLTFNVRKFEGIYGPISAQMLDQAWKGLGPGSHLLSPTSQEAETPGTTETKLPVVVSTLLIALGWLVTLPLQPPSTGGKDWMSALTLDHPTPLHFAFLGAYFFSLQMLFRRYVLRDLRPSAYMAISIRIILATIGTWVVTATAQPMGLMGLKLGEDSSGLLVVGFVIGVFPPVVWQFAQSAFKRIGAGFFLPSLKSQLPISDLDGLTVWHEARLEEEGIENIPNMAMADIVELMVQTRLPPEQIIDWVDQAILYTNLGPQSEKKKDGLSPRQKLRAQGVRTATSLQVSYEKCLAGPDRDAFEKVLSPPGGSEVRSPMRSLVDALTTNSNLGLIRTWKGMPSAT